MGIISKTAWGLAFGAAVPADYLINNYKRVSVCFAAASIGWAGIGVAQKYDGLNSLEIQLRAQGKSEVVAKCLTDVTSRRYPWTATVFKLDVANTIIQKGHELAAGGTVTECKPR